MSSNVGKNAFYRCLSSPAYRISRIITSKGLIRRRSSGAPMLVNDSQIPTTFLWNTPKRSLQTATAMKPPSLDNHPSWQEIFPAPQFVSIWEQRRRQQQQEEGQLAFDDAFGDALDDDEALDIASRHVIDLIQRFYRRGYSKIPCFVTRDWCHHVLQQLSGGDLQQQQQHGTTITYARTQRARALLETMQLMDQLDARSAPFELPRPNGKTYRIVLDMYQRTPPLPDSLQLAQGALDLVLRMERNYRTAADLYLRPTVVEWNIVLQTFANAQHDQRGPHAVKVLVEHMISSEGNLMADASSLIFALRACGFKVPSTQAARTGAIWAATLWERLVQDPVAQQRLWPTVKSQFYSLFLQTIRHLPPSDQRERLFAQSIHQASQYGKVNAIIIQEFIMHAKPWAVVQSVLGADRLATVVGLSPKEAAQRLVASLPGEWKQQQDGR